MFLIDQSLIIIWDYPAHLKMLAEYCFEKRQLAKGMKLPKIRTDNGPQFIAKKFAKTCKYLEMKHERIPVKTPNMNAHIESFHSILEEECYGINEFNSYMEAYSIISNYMNYYNRRRRYGSLNYKTPEKYYKVIMSNSASAEPFVA